LSVRSWEKRWVLRRGLVLAWIASAGWLMGPKPGNAQYGGGGGEFLRFGVGGRALGLGGAFAGIADDASAIFYNPAGLPQLDRITFSYMSAALFLDSRYQFGAFVWPFYTGLKAVEKVSVGLGYVAFGMEGFELRESGTHRELGRFADRQQAFVFPVGADWVGTWGRLGFACEANLVSHELAGYGDQGWGYGASVFFQPFDFPSFLWPVESLRLPILGQPFSLENMMKWRLGLTYRRLPSLVLFEESEKLPDVLRFGVSYQTPLLDSRLWLLVTWERVWGALGGGRSVAGAEAGSSLMKGVSARLRFAYRPGEEWEGRRVVWGLGLSSEGYRIGQVYGTLSLDYVYEKHQELEGSVNGLFLSLQLAGGNEDVVQGDVLRADPIKQRGRLLRTLSWHPRDVRRVGFHVHREVVDGRYRDGSAVAESTEPADSTGVAEILWSLESDTSHWARRLDDFILGFFRLNRQTAKALAAYRHSFGVEKRPLLELLPKYELRRGKLTKCSNVGALRQLLNLCVASGNVPLCHSLLGNEGARTKCLSKNDSLFFAALMGDSLARSRQLGPSGTIVHNDTLSYLSFLEGFANGDSAALERAIDKGGSFWFERFPMAPLLADGIVADDAQLLKAIRSNDEAETRRLSLELMLKYPLSDAALIAASLSSPQEMERYYRNELRPGGVIDYRRVAGEGPSAQEAAP